MTFGAGHAEAVERRADRAGDMRAVAVLVHVRRVVAGAIRLVGAGAVHERDVDGEVAAQRRVEVGRDVRMGAVDARVEHADADPAVALLDPYEPAGVARISAMSHWSPPSGSAAGAAAVPAVSFRTLARSAAVRRSAERCGRAAGAL